ncbi:MAG: hypothetical protein J5511_03200 [Bacilli bacterium]|nr:hypothetical protein [Bacilli bacterium]
MQTLNKSLMKNTLTYTWFIYPMSAVILTLIWFWSFPAFHQPSAHQKINVFFATEMKSEEYLDKILTQYDREDLRQINATYATKTNPLYAQKLQIALSDSDILVLPKETFQKYSVDYSLFFVEVNTYVQEKCQVNETVVVDNYGIILKNQGVDHYLDNYMTFEDADYVIAFSTSSKNLGAAVKEDNAPYDNALTFVHYLIEGVK